MHHVVIVERCETSAGVSRYTATGVYGEYEISERNVVSSIVDTARRNLESPAVED